MSTTYKPINRKIIPRWRDSLVAATTGELRPLRLPDVTTPRSLEDLTSRIDDWRHNRSLAFASDLLSVGFVLNVMDTPELRDAAKYILSLGHNAPLPAQELAKEFTFGSEHDPDNATGVHEEDVDVVQQSRMYVRLLKGRLNSNPRNGLSWVDLARHYAMLGQLTQAKRAMQNGLLLAPDNRFVLRSAVRLYVHCQDPERAIHTLTRSNVTSRDPWLRAAEIAVSGLTGRTPPRLRQSRRTLRSGRIDSRNVSELASAVATFEMDAGSNRSARRLFNLALEFPTENSVAQADWASERINGISLSQDHFLLPRTFEAKANDHFNKLDWAECFNECRKWLDDEPYSSRPVELGTFVAILAFNDYNCAVSLARRGLISNSESFLLRNNLSLALAELGQLQEARSEFTRVDSSGLDDFLRTGWMATQGLLAFRGNNDEEGRSSYSAAVDLARRQAEGILEIMALIHWAREERRIGKYQIADELAEYAFEAAKGLSSPIVELVFLWYDNVKHHDENVIAERSQLT